MPGEGKRSPNVLKLTYTSPHALDIRQFTYISVEKYLCKQNTSRQGRRCRRANLFCSWVEKVQFSSATWLVFNPSTNNAMSCRWL